MSVTVTLRCDTTACPARLDAPGSTLGDTRITARMDGWTSHRAWHKEEKKFVTADYCPAHTRRHEDTHRLPLLHASPPRDACPILPCMDEPLADLLGHDLLGHRITRILARNGITTRAQLAALEEAELLDMRGLGAHALIRIRYILRDPDGH